MKHLLFLILLLPILSMAQFKAPNRFQNTDIHDYTGTLSIEQKSNLDIKIQELRKSSIEMAIVILPDLQGYEVDEAALSIGRTWGVGKSKINNGIIYVIVPSMRKANLSVGSGLEGDLPDILTSQLQDEIKPYYRNNQYYEGINHLLSRITEVLSPVYKEQQLLYAQQQQKEADEVADKVLLVLQIVLVLLALGIGIFYIKKKERQRREAKREQERLKAVEEYRIISEARDLDYFKTVFIKNANATFEKSKKDYTEIQNKAKAYGVQVSDTTPYIKDIVPALIKGEHADTYKESENLKRVINYTQREIHSIVNQAAYKINQIDNAISGFKAHIKRLPEQYEKAKNNIHKTPYQKEKLCISTYNVLIDQHITRPIDYIYAFNSLQTLLSNYDEIINYESREAERQRQKLDKQKREKECEKERIANKKRDEQDEDDRRRRRSDSDNSYSNNYSYSSGGSDNSYGGGSFDGGGSNSSW